MNKLQEYIIIDHREEDLIQRAEHNMQNDSSNELSTNHKTMDSSIPVLQLSTLPSISHKRNPGISNESINSTSYRLSRGLHTSLTAHMVECYKDMMLVSDPCRQTYLDLLIKIWGGHMMYYSARSYTCEDLIPFPTVYTLQIKTHVTVSYV